MSTELTTAPVKTPSATPASVGAPASVGTPASVRAPAWVGAPASVDAPGGVESTESVDTPYGRVQVDRAALLLGELLVTDEGAELEVVGLDPLRLELAPEMEEDWGE